MVLPPPVISVDSPTSRFDTQDGTDRAYIKSLASQSGYVFYVEPGPLPLQSTAYFGPDIRTPDAAACAERELRRRHERRVAQLRSGRAGEEAGDPVHLRPADEEDLVPIPVPDINPLHPPLGLRPTPPAQASTLATETDAPDADGAGQTRFWLHAAKVRMPSAAPGRSTSPNTATCCVLADRGRAWSRPRVRRLLLRRQRHSQHQARRIQAELPAFARWAR